jgi:ribosomal protein L19
MNLVTYVSVYSNIIEAKKTYTNKFAGWCSIISIHNQGVTK